MKNFKRHTFLKWFTFIVLVCTSFLSAGCISSNFSVETLAKSDIDMVSDIHVHQTLTLLKTLTRKLYKMNPGELTKTPGATIESRISGIFKCPAPPPEPALSGRRSTNAMLAGLEPDYEGDRVYAIMYGLITNTCEGDISNLSFERIFGKLIALSDTMALIMAEQGDRFIKQAVQIAGMSFLPVGI